MISLKQLMQPEGEAPTPWWRSAWIVPLPAILLSVAAVVVLLRGVAQ